MNKIILVILLSFSIANGFKVEQAFNIKTIKVKSLNIAKSKEFYGKVMAKESSVFDIALRFDGFINNLYANEKFILIKKNDRLFDIYSKEISNLYDELKVSKLSSKSLYQSTLNKFKYFDISASQFNKQNKSIYITSKFNGFITQKNINQGSFIKKGKTILQITNLESVWAIANIYQKDIDFIKENMDASIVVDGISKTYLSKVDFIYPNINTKDQTIQVRILVENKDLKLFPNMFAKIKIFEKEKNMLVLPKNAIVQRAGKKYVFFKDGNNYSPNEVTATKVGKYYQISEGLELGDEVVTNALFLLDSDAVTNGLYSDDW